MKKKRKEEEKYGRWKKKVGGEGEGEKMRNGEKMQGKGESKRANGIEMKERSKNRRDGEREKWRKKGGKE